MSTTKKNKKRFIEAHFNITFTNTVGFAILVFSCYYDFNIAGLTAGTSLMLGKQFFINK